jgi:hypothetical protein
MFVLHRESKNLTLKVSPRGFFIEMFCVLCQLLEAIQGYSFVFFVVFLALVTNF